MLDQNTEKKQYDQRLVEIGSMLKRKRLGLGTQYQNREAFIDLRSEEIFGGSQWISPRYLASIELGNNWISIEKLVKLADALEENPVELFEEIMKIYTGASR